MVIAVSLLASAAGATPSGCTSIQDIPIAYTITYGAAIQGLFDNFSNNGSTTGCVSCDKSPASGAAGHLDLTDGVSFGHLVDVPSYNDPSVMYVISNHPEQSLLFQKINCDTPATGQRMPYGYPPGTLTPEQQALIYDWIAEGAPFDTTNGIFRDGFDPRGFTDGTSAAGLAAGQ